MNMQSKEDSRTEKFKHALDDVSQLRLSVREAASKWGVPKSTLHDRLSGRIEVHRRAGPPTVLTKAEETRIADWLIEMAHRGFGCSKDDLLDTVKKLVDGDGRTTPFNDNRPGDKWYRGFMDRNPQIRLRSTRPLDKKRAKISSADLDEWFTGYEKFTHDQGLQNRPAQIWNCDESGFDLQGRAGRVLGPTTKEKPYHITTGTKEHITVLPCFNACGQWIPPYLLFAGKRVPTKYNPLEGGVPGSAFSMTESGYMDTPSFYMWLANHFIPNIPPVRPVVLLVDSHTSHIDLESFELSRQNKIHIYALLKNATHLVQPADVGLFGTMKKTWYKNARRYSQTNPNSEINKKNFCSVFRTTWDEVMRPSLLVDAFRMSGIYPLDRAQISNEKIKPSLVYAAETTSTTTTAGKENCASASSLSTPSDKETSNTRSAASAFDALNNSLDTPTKAKYQRRIDEGYDLPGSPVFIAWKGLYESVSEKENDISMQSSQASNSCSLSPVLQSSTLTSQSSVSASGNTRGHQSPSLPKQSSSIFDDILVYPSAQESVKKPRNNVKIPNFMTSDRAMKILLDEKLKKAREVAEKQKKLREKAEKREAKRKEAERKKKVEKKNKNPTKRKRKSMEIELSENTCKVCLVDYQPTDDEECPWVMCDKCLAWMHIECVPIGVDMTPIDDDEQFFCHECM